MKLYILKVWDPTCLSNELWKGCGRKLQDFDGAQLNLNDHVVFKRGLSYQAYQAYLRCCSPLKEMPLHYGSPGTYKAFTQMELLKQNFERDVSNELELDDDC